MLTAILIIAIITLFICYFSLQGIHNRLDRIEDTLAEMQNPSEDPFAVLEN
jgi:hypothetical protein